MSDGSPTRILVATDLSPQAGLAVSRAAQLASEHGAALSALYVVPEDLDAGLIDEAERALLAHLADYLDLEGVAAAVRSGRAACEIARAAVDHRADVVIVGAHGERGLVEAFLGTTADNLIRISPTPVLLVRRPVDGAYRTVVLAVDTSEPSAQAAQVGCDLAPTADHILIHACVVIGEDLMKMHGATDDEIEQLRRSVTGYSRDYLAQLSEALKPCPTRVVVTTGHPPTRLVELSQSCAAEAIVVGTGARAPIAYALLGSVAQYVMRESASDVLVVPAVNG